VAEPAARLERRGHIGIITLNRPEVLNAVNAEMSGIVGDALDTIEHDDSVWVAVISGGNGRAFCVGADLHDVAEGRSLVADGLHWGFGGVTRHTISKPVIAAVNGLAYGGGAEIALACDLIVAADTAAFALPEVKRGLIAAAGGLVRLPRQVPVKVAMHMALTGEPVDAETARHWGLVNVVVSADKVLDAALELAEQICRNAPLAVQATKRVLAGIIDGDIPDERAAWERNAAERRAVWASEDAKEGPKAFAEKREPQWRGA
jgi:crotonobetainyl-CoA hydratase